MIAKLTPEIVDDVRRTLAQGGTEVEAVVSDNGRSADFYLRHPLTVSPVKALTRQDDVIRRYCYAPFVCWCSTGMYRFRLGCN